MQQRGFTLVELIIVIVILGVLAVTAAPRFLDIQGDARGATVQGMAAAMRTASDTIYAKSLIQGTNTTATSTVTLNNGQSVTTAYGYPLHDWNTAWDELLEANITLVTNTAPCPDEFCVNTSFDLSGLGLTVGNNADQIALVIFPRGNASTGNCLAYYIYDQGTADGRPLVGSDITGCN